MNADASNLLEQLLPFIGIPIFFLVFFILFNYLLPMFGGWKHLAKRYSTQQAANTISGERIYIRQVNIGGMNMKNIVRFYKTHRGLFMSQIALFRGKQPNLLIPWDAFKSVQHKKILFFKSVRLSIGSPEVSYLEMSAKDFEKFKDRISLGA
jgi:hypothetical protein